MKKDEIRATFIIEREAWQLFRLMANRFRSYDEDKGITKPATASDLLREYINDFFVENKKVAFEILEELRHHNVESPLREALEQWKKEDEEQHE